MSRYGGPRLEITRRASASLSTTGSRRGPLALTASPMSPSGCARTCRYRKTSEFSAWFWVDAATWRSTESQLRNSFTSPARIRAGWRRRWYRMKYRIQYV